MHVWIHEARLRRMSIWHYLVSCLMRNDVAALRSNRSQDVVLPLARCHSWNFDCSVMSWGCNVSDCIRICCWTLILSIAIAPYQHPLMHRDIIIFRIFGVICTSDFLITTENLTCIACIAIQSQGLSTLHTLRISKCHNNNNQLRFPVGWRTLWKVQINRTSQY